ncbi:MAG: DoxX family protein [Bacteroidia bacterium]|nr:DoxX family protein [Bacteroidia bacterium]
MWKSLLFGTNKGARGHWGLLALRVFAGMAMAISHGWKKMPPSERFIQKVSEMGFPAPEFFGWAASLSEFAGGILIAIGLFTRPSAFFLSITMAVAAFLGHGGDAFSEREKALLYGILSIFLFIQGPGKYSIDWLINKKIHPSQSI